MQQMSHSRWYVYANPRPAGAAKLHGSPRWRSLHREGPPGHHFLATGALLFAISACALANSQPITTADSLNEPKANSLPARPSAPGGSAPSRGATSSLGSARDIAVSVSALAAALIAVMGVNAWRRQLKGMTEYQIALKVLKALYALRESFIEARGRFTFPAEWTERTPDASGRAEFMALSEGQSYQHRLSRVGSARADLLVAQQEALAVWGDPAEDALDELFRATDDMFAAYNRFFEEELARARRKDRDGTEVEPDADLQVMHRILYAMPDREGNDPFGKRITRAVARAEDFYRSRLK